MNLFIYSILALLQITFVHSYICPEPYTDILCDDAAKIKYYLYTKNNAEYTEIFTNQLTGVTINEGCPFIFIAHGFLNTGFQPWVLAMIQAFMDVKCVNVVAIDWSAVYSVFNYIDSTIAIYPYSAYKTCCSGEHVGDLILDINKSLGASLDSMLFVGHSLGAHLGGCAGKYVISKTGSSLGQITGLDPAGPIFDGEPDVCRLSADDSELVQVMHTDKDGLGTKLQCGDVDFYPNGGEAQPCDYLSLAGQIPGACSHAFAFLLMIQSIQNKGFISNSCDNYVYYELGLCTNNPTSEMGYQVTTTARGRYYLDTTGTAPYTMNGKRKANILGK